MIREWINWVAAGIAAFAFLLLCASAVLKASQASHIPVLEVAAANEKSPPPAFEQEPQAYNAIAESTLQLKSAPTEVQLPDLRQAIVYYGKNGRPDADLNNGAIFLSTPAAKEVTTVLPNETIYMLYDKKLSPPRYIFSPNNDETSLWIEVTPHDKEVSVKVSMKNQKGDVISEPAGNANFNLQEKPFARSSGTTAWEIGKHRADGTLLVQQRAKWFGSDQFLERHGGKEFQDYLGKQRVDFGEGNDVYSVFVKPNDILVWDNDHWRVAEPGAETSEYAILVVKKIDDKLMNFELWNREGKNKVLLNLLKSSEVIPPGGFTKNFKFLSAKTRSQFVFEVDKERMTLSPQDWVLSTGSSWKKLTTPEDIDSYVDRKIIGYLFVIDSIEKRDDRQVMLATFFNKSRSSAQQIEIPLQGTAAAVLSNPRKPGDMPNMPPQPGKPNFPPKAMENINDDEDDDDDDEEGLKNIEQRSKENKLSR